MKGKSRTLAGVILAAAVVVAVATQLGPADESTFAPSPLSQVVGQAQNALTGGELPFPLDMPLLEPAADEPDQQEGEQEEPPRRPTSYKAVREFREDGLIQGEAIESTGTDESAVAVLDDHAQVILLDVTVERRSPSSTGGLLATTYGVGSALLAAPGQLTVGGSTVSTNAAGGAGLFALGKRSEAFIADSTVSTQQSASGGLAVVEGASLCAWDTQVRTEGTLSPAAFVGSEGGSMVLQGVTLMTSGQDSPVLSSQGDLTVLDGSLSASRSHAVQIEGKNAVRLFDCLVSSNPRNRADDDCRYNVALYQGSEADTSTGRSTFHMVGGSLSAREGGLFYVTNTQATIVLQGADFSLADDAFFLRCSGNTGGRGWGTAGGNGAVCSLTGIGQLMEGDILWDSLSQVTVYLTEGSQLVGAVGKDDSFAGNPTTAMAKGQANLVIDKSSSWTVTGDSTLSSLSCEGVLSDAEGRPVTIKSPEGATFVKGTSPYTITVTDFSIVVDVSSAVQPDARADYELERPEVLLPTLEEDGSGEETQAAAAELEDSSADGDGDVADGAGPQDAEGDEGGSL